MNPTVWMYGGIHHDPGSRQKFVEELAKQNTLPHFVSVEWEESFFERVVALRPLVEEGLKSCCDFLTSQERHELSLALAWEGDAYKVRFPDADPLWLETGFQEANFRQRYDAESPKVFANSLLERLRNPCSLTMSEFQANAECPPDPQSKKELIDRVWKKAWAEASSDNNFERDARWASAICNRISGLHNGWIAVVVGWAHANPATGNKRLRGLLLAKGFSVNSIRLGP